jgi:hypothetical protein
MGTETRRYGHFFFLSRWLGSDDGNVNRPPNQYIAPVQEPYGYIIFRASEVKDLSVDEPPPAQSQHNVHDDPAVLGVRSFSFLCFFFPPLTMMKSFRM